MDYKWHKFKGIDDDIILTYLPETIQNDILLSTMSDIVYKIINPDCENCDESGPILDMLRKF